MSRFKKGQLGGGVATNMLALLVIVAVAFVSITVFNNLDTNLATGLTGEALAAKNNYSSGTWDAIQIMALAPYLKPYEGESS